MTTARTMPEEPTTPDPLSVTRDLLFALNDEERLREAARMELQTWFGISAAGIRWREVFTRGTGGF